MKKNLILIASITLVLASCGGSKKAVKPLTAVEQPKVQVEVKPKDISLSVEANREIVMPLAENAKPNPVKLVSFINVDDLTDLNPGMTKQEVFTKLGKKPFDIISNQADGYSIYLYKYRKVHTILNDQNENTLGASGPKEYGTKIQDAFVVFNKENKLELVVSKDEMSRSESIHKFHGVLYNLTVNGGKLFIKPIITKD